METSNLSEEAKEVLHLLRKRRNVLLSGPPGTGKSRLLNEIGNAFETYSLSSTASQIPMHDPKSDVLIPEIGDLTGQKLQNVIPAPNRTNRKVFRTTFHQNSKYREFVTGLMPRMDGEQGFKIVYGTLYKASEHAKISDGASLLIIDEINRGPAVQVFGGSIVAIEQEKRLLEDNTPQINTQFFEILTENGEVKEYALPEHLYILAAMNEADSSVEPLDVAFLRRWALFRLVPNPKIIREFYNLDDSLTDLPKSPNKAKDVYDAAERAWEYINRKIELGRGEEFQLGHGIFFTSQQPPSDNIDEALEEMTEVWGYIKAHIDEVFFGDVRGIAETLNVKGQSHHLFKLEEKSFADEPRIELVGPKKVKKNQIYNLLRAIAQ